MDRTLIFFLAVLLGAASAADWGYTGSTGPDYWGQGCKGQSQSPIDLPRFTGEKTKYDGFSFENYDVLPEQMELENNAHTVVLSIKPKGDGKVPKVSGGGLPGKYAFAQFHFHWGMNDDVGSEHTIGERAYPMEVHLVHYNTEYGNTLGKAIAGGRGAQDTLAVLGIMFDKSRAESKAMKPVTDALGKVADPQTKDYTQLFKLSDLLPEDTERFFRYNGSLTTPGCNEIVVWTVFKESIPISSGQMEKFRSLTRTSPGLRDNFRPVLPLNGRKVLDVTTAGASATAAAVSVIAVAAAALLKNM